MIEGHPPIKGKTTLPRSECPESYWMGANSSPISVPILPGSWNIAIASRIALCASWGLVCQDLFLVLLFVHQPEAAHALGFVFVPSGDESPHLRLRDTEVEEHPSFVMAVDLSLLNPFDLDGADFDIAEGDLASPTASEWESLFLPLAHGSITLISLSTISRPGISRTGMIVPF